MKMKVVENKKDKMTVEVEEVSHTILNVIRENAWKAGATQASYMIKHPYLSTPKMTISAKNPKKVLTDASQMLIDDSKTFERSFKRALKK